MAIALEFSRRAKQLGDATGEREGAAFQERVRAVFAATLYQLSFVVPHIQVRRRAGHIVVDDLLGLRAELRLPRGKRIVLRRQGRCAAVAREQRREGDGAEAELALLEEMPTRDVVKSVELRVHHDLAQASRALRA